MEDNIFYLTANGKTFVADFADNTSAEAFKRLLEEGGLAIDMHDYAGFEKVGELGIDLIRNDTVITTEPGDIILYLGNKITVYYDTNSWDFTLLGRIRNVNKEILLDSFGNDDVTVKFSLMDR